MIKQSRLPTEAEKKRWRREALERSSKGLAPDYQLAPLRKFSKEALIPMPSDSDDAKALKRLTLTFALVFNDLKDLSWARGVLEYWSPRDKNAVDAYAGQWNGMRGFFVRHLCGVLAELGEVIEAKRSVLESPALTAAKANLAKARPSALKAWEGMLTEFGRPAAASLNEGASGFGKPQGRKSRPKLASKVARCVAYLRHKTAYHYGHEGSEDRLLAEGFAKHCNANLDDRYRYAFASLGANMEGSRFYFADAAIGRVAQDGFEGEDVSLDEMYEFVTNINYALRFMVESLLLHLTAQLESKNSTGSES